MHRVRVLRWDRATAGVVERLESLCTGVVAVVAGSAPSSAFGAAGAAPPADPPVEPPISRFSKAHVQPTELTRWREPPGAQAWDWLGLRLLVGAS